MDDKRGILNSKRARKRAFQKRLDLLEDQRTVSTTETEGVTQGVLHTANLACFVRHKIEVAANIRVIEVDGWRNGLIAQRKIE
ncbi:Uncharacterised protein [Cedecea neteri]|uniref:Uncharacterized protein n=1 Tax=Cedecea neteri TaxID=158822 RepID=A0A2X3JDJ1_9ENTR|nr:Uncharacterised protein [Cedecea neteri]